MKNKIVFYYADQKLIEDLRSELGNVKGVDIEVFEDDDLSKVVITTIHLIKFGNLWGHKQGQMLLTIMENNDDLIYKNVVMYKNQYNTAVFEG